MKKVLNKVFIGVLCIALFSMFLTIQVRAENEDEMLRKILEEEGFSEEEIEQILAGEDGYSAGGDAEANEEFQNNDQYEDDEPYEDATMGEIYENDLVYEGDELNDEDQEEYSDEQEETEDNQNNITYGVNEISKSQQEEKTSQEKQSNKEDDNSQSKEKLANTGIYKYFYLIIISILIVTLLRIIYKKYKNI